MILMQLKRDVSIALMVIIITASIPLVYAEPITISMKNIKKTTLLSIKNNSDRSMHSITLSFDDGIRFTLAKGWERKRVDDNTVMLTSTNGLAVGRNLVVILVLNNPTADYRWSVMDANNNVIAGNMEEKSETREPFTPTKLSSPVTITGAGSTFVFPLMDKWRVEYNKINPQVTLNYQSIGSGGGIKQFSEKTVDYGATDAPLSDKEFTEIGDAIHIPVTIGSVVAAYNLLDADGNKIPTGLKLTPDVLADIFLKKITKWDDERIKALNPDIKMPSKGIIVVHRSDGSGTTYVWTDYLSKVSQEWNEKVGKGKAVQWPTGIGAAGNEGVAGVIKMTPYSIGYIELAYAIKTDISHAALKNKEGEFITASLEATAKAAANTVHAGLLPKSWENWSNVSIVDAPGSGSYPVASFVYVLLHENMNNLPLNEEKARAIVEFLYWSVTDGQEYSKALEYVPLPQEVQEISIEGLKKVKFDSKTLIQ